ncbi:MAG TPA: trehalose-phosphatase [Rhodocyclaceae bacterium]|nr:trehalose-phosphatase [Rhodocyclaceae bacterium]
MELPQENGNLPPVPSTGWAYFLDVDGTLLDIAENPNAIHVDQALLRLLDRLHRASGGAVALISGRAISDLDRRLGNLQLPRAGQHGLERRDAAGRLWLHATPPEAKDRIRIALEPLMEDNPGLLLEDKGLTLALHYRQVPELEEQVNALMTSLIAEAGGSLVLQKGKCVAEAKPANFDKGTAIEEYLTEAPFKGRLPVFIGDDLNDEHGFAHINRVGGLSIKVGEEATCARYRLADVAAVRSWLGLTLPTYS